MNNRFYLKILPHVVSILAGAGLLSLYFKISDEIIKSLFLSMSSTLFAIPLIFFFYELIKRFSDKKLNIEVYNYAKWKVDEELLSISMQLTKRICDLESSNDLDRSLGFYDSLNELRDKIKNRKFIGFQIFKEVEFSENALDKILENPFVLNKLGNKEIILIISIVKDISRLSSILKDKKLFSPLGKSTKEFKIISGNSLNEANGLLYPERYLILKKLDSEKGIVFDFGDYKQENLNNLLGYFKINDDLLEDYCKIIFKLLRDIEKWYIQTGNKMIIDTKRFKKVKND